MDGQSSDARPAPIITILSHWAAEGPTELRPGSAAVSRFEYSGAEIAIAAKILLTGSHIDGAGIRRIERDGADGARGLRVGQGSPSVAAICRFPNAALRASQIHCIHVARIDT